jgi:hypothetical protein
MTDTTQPGANALDLDKLEALARAATPGPWKMATDWNRAAVYADHSPYKRVVCSGNQNNSGRYSQEDWSGADWSDAAFIARANPAAVLALIALARRAAPALQVIDAPRVESIDMNEMFTVTLTAAGAKMRNDHYAWMREKYPENAPKLSVEGDMLKDHLWELFKIFGEHITLGMDVPFVGNIITPAAPTAPQVPRVEVPQGWKLVPVEPTNAMYFASCRAFGVWRNTTTDQPDWTHRDTYRAMLAAAPAAPIARQAQPTDRDAEEMRKIGNVIATQDNRITDAPIFVVEQKQPVVSDSDYNDCRVEWRETENGDYSEATPERAARLEALFHAGRDTPGWRRYEVTDIWVFVTACFTAQGCRDYLARNGHNLRETRVYAYGSYRNEEYRAVRKYLMSMADNESAPALKSEQKG